MEPISTTLSVFFKKHILESILFLCGFVFFRAVLEDMALKDGLIGSIGKTLYAGVAGVYAGTLVSLSLFIVAPNYQLLPVLGFLIGGALGLKYINYIIKHKIEEKIKNIKL